MPTSNAPRIVCLGDAAVDVFVALEEGAVVGSDANGLVRISPGGSAANVAVWLARLGASAGFIGAVGDDYAGGFVRADLEREGVTCHLLRVPAATAAIAVLLDEAGERTMIANRAAATLLTPDFIGPHTVPSGSRLHLPAYSLFVTPLAGAALAAADRCREAGGGISVDTSSVGPLRVYGRERFLELLDRISPDVLFANDDEGTFLSGTSDPEEGSLFLQRFAPVVVWKLGAAGAVARGDTYVRVEGLDIPVLDTTGAGDAFAAAFLCAYVQDVPLAESLDRANRVAAAVVQHIGARPRLALDVTGMSDNQS
ncbi:MAG: PfkB domain protein [Chloroflexi bacterium]|nr:PfkB domain protein [Chloroflexota bacterium]